MNAPDDSTPNDGSFARGLRDWWLSAPRSGTHRLISPWEYRHLRLAAGIRIVGGCIDVGAGVVCLSYRAYPWAGFFLALGALNLAGGGWYLAVANSAPTANSAPAGA